MPIDYTRPGEVQPIGGVQEIAQGSLRQLEQGHARLLVEAAAMFRWLLAAAFVLNIFAILALLTLREALPSQALVEGIWHFSLGAIAALVAAVVGAVTSLVIAGAIARTMTYWMEVTLSGQLSDEAAKSAVVIRKRTVLWHGVMASLCILSLGLFAFGVLATCKGIEAPSSVAAAEPAEPPSANPSVREVAASPAKDQVAAPKPASSQSPTPPKDKAGGTAKQVKEPSPTTKTGASAPVTKPKSPEIRPVAPEPKKAVDAAVPAPPKQAAPESPSPAP